MYYNCAFALCTNRAEPARWPALVGPAAHHAAVVTVTLDDRQGSDIPARHHRGLSRAHPGYPRSYGELITTALVARSCPIENGSFRGTSSCVAQLPSRWPVRVAATSRKGVGTGQVVYRSAGAGGMS